MTKNYNAIDLLKIIMAICVVSIHTVPLTGVTNAYVNSFYDSFVSLAVPFFFLASGFLLANKFDDVFYSDNNQNAVKKTLINFLKLYLIWTVIYLPMTIYHFVSEGTIWWKSILLFIRGFIFIGEQYNSWPLWYLLSSIYALIVILICMKLKFNRKHMTVVSVIFFAAVLVFNFLSSQGESTINFVVLLSKFTHVSIANGRIFNGAFFIPTGVLIQYNFSFFKKRCMMISSFLAFVLFYFINVFVTNGTISTILNAAAAIGLFSTVCVMNLPNSSFYPVVRKMSTCIYFIHMYIWTGYYMIVYGTKTYGFDCFLWTCLISVFISLIYVFLKNIKLKRKQSIA